MPPTIKITVVNELISKFKILQIFLRREGRGLQDLNWTVILASFQTGNKTKGTYLGDIDSKLTNTESIDNLEITKVGIYL